MPRRSPTRRRQFGSPLHADEPIPADYDGDGAADIAVYRALTAEWFIAGSQSGFLGAVPFGAFHLGDAPVPADYDGDGRADLALFRQMTAEWFVLPSAGVSVASVQFGNPALGDRPLR